MGRPKRDKFDMFDMFDEFTVLSGSVRMLGGIVQNEGIEVNDNQILEWSNDVNKLINKLNSLREDVIRFYQD